MKRKANIPDQPNTGNFRKRVKNPTELDRLALDADDRREDLRQRKTRPAFRKAQYELEQADNREGGIIDKLRMIPTAARRAQIVLAERGTKGSRDRRESKLQAEIDAADRAVTDNLGRGSDTQKFSKGGDVRFNPNRGKTY